MDGLTTSLLDQEEDDEESDDDRSSRGGMDEQFFLRSLRETMSSKSTILSFVNTIEIKATNLEYKTAYLISITTTTSSRAGSGTDS